MSGYLKIFSIISLVTLLNGFSYNSCAEEIKDNSYNNIRARKIPRTGQIKCYNEATEIICPKLGDPFYGQDAQFPSAVLYQDNKDGTVTDLITGLVWQKKQDPKMTWEEAKEYATQSRLAGKDDWRLPTITELYSLISFAGRFGTSAGSSTPFIDTQYFDFQYSEGMDIRAGEGTRWIDVQNWSSTKYVGLTMRGDITIFGVNFADGRIKGYPEFKPGSNNTIARDMYVRLVSGKPYGIPKLVSKTDGTVIDESTALMWQKKDDGITRNWQDALAYCTNLKLNGFADWRLPNAKELQYIVDYSRSPTATNSPAIYPEFETTNTESYFWTSTTVLGGPADNYANSAAYIAFGRALGYMEMPPRSGNRTLIDVHGAGAQRVGFKAGDPANYPQGHGPQGDDERIYNYVRCVRDY